MCHDRNVLSPFEWGAAVLIVTVTFSLSGSKKARHFGLVETWRWFVPKLESNLISVRKLVAKGGTIIFDSD